MRKLIRMCKARLPQTVVLILIQLILWIAFFYLSAQRYMQIGWILRALSIVSVLLISGSSMDASMKLMWIVLILLFPLVGGGLWLLLHGKTGQRQLINDIDDEHQCLLKGIEHSWVSRLFYYVLHCSDSHLCHHSVTEYFECGEAMREKMLLELNKAERLVLIEFFIVAEGEFLSEVLKILEKKIQEGVQVFLIYDDVGCLLTLPEYFFQKLKEIGVHVLSFNPLRPLLSLRFNVRDHRKMLIIDNQTAFVGGCNLADEYVNQKKKFGYWKDTAVMVKGDAALHCGRMFQHFWDAHASFSMDEALFQTVKEDASDGLVLPFSDDCLNEEHVGLNVHLKLIHGASEYIYIQTPYLIVNDEIRNALCAAAKSGVDVRVTVPHVPDRWFVHVMTQDSYQILLRSGVGIYEYLPGFIHSKMMICDDVIGMCGSINMDYRSYVHQHECSILMYRSKALKQMKQDAVSVMSQCIQITAESCEKVPVYVKIFRTVLRLFKPML